MILRPAAIACCGQRLARAKRPPRLVGNRIEGPSGASYQGLAIYDEGASAHVRHSLAKTLPSWFAAIAAAFTMAEPAQLRFEFSKDTLPPDAPALDPSAALSRLQQGLIAAALDATRATPGSGTLVIHGGLRHAREACAAPAWRLRLWDDAQRRLLAERPLSAEEAFGDASAARSLADWLAGTSGFDVHFPLLAPSAHARAGLRREARRMGFAAGA